MYLCNDFERGNAKAAAKLVSSMTVYDDFLSVDEEETLCQEIEPYIKRLRYEFDHWDNVSYTILWNRFYSLTSN